MTLLGVHITDLKNRVSIERTGLKSGSSTNLWLGSGPYHYGLASIRDLDHCIKSGKFFAMQNPAFSGQVLVVLSQIRTDRLVQLQDEIVMKSLRNYKDIFDEKCKKSNIVLPMNSNLLRPASFIRYEIWRYLANIELNDALRGNSISGAICRFSKDAGEDIPYDLPREICVYDTNVHNIEFLGSPEEVRTHLSNNLNIQNGEKATDSQFQLQVVGATATATSRIKEMELRDFKSLIFKYMDESQQSSNIVSFKTIQTREGDTPLTISHVPHDRLMSAVRTKRLDEGVCLSEEILEHDLTMIFKDYERRLRTTNQIPLDVGDISLRIGQISNDPTFAAKDLARRFGKKNAFDVFETILKKLPIEIRKLKGLKGQAYYFPKGQITELAVLVTKKGASYKNGKPLRLAYDRGHELGHFIFQECKISADDEELWCDRFAAALIDEIEKGRQSKATNFGSEGFQNLMSER